MSNKSKMEQQEIDFVNQQLNTFDACSPGIPQNQLIPSDILVDVLEQVLRAGINSGPDMQVVQCLFQTIFLSERNVTVKGRGVYHLSKGVNKWFRKITPVNAGSMSKIYKTYIINQNIEAIIKLTTKLPDFLVLREYFVGLVLNNLRYQIPNFLYTLGSFSCSKPVINTSEICTENKNYTNFILYEKIDGITVSEAISRKMLTVLEWVPVFAMILMALEVAQREYRFTHYDLHCGNVMLVKNIPTYDVVLDDFVYTVKNPKYVPVLIDFGFSSVYTDGRNVGLSAVPEMYNFMVPAFDMYLFLIASIVEFMDIGDPNIGIVTDLFALYSGSSDIIPELAPGGDPSIYTQFKKKLVATPSDASQTPLEMLKLLFRNHGTVLDGRIIRKIRDKLYSLNFSSSVKNYSDILGFNQSGTEQAIKLASSCLESNTSFLLTKYQTYIMTRYNRIFKSKSLDENIKKITDQLPSNSVENDISELNKVFSIEILDKTSINSTINSALETPIFGATAGTKKAVVSSIKTLSDHMSQIEPYFDAYYTIQELALGNIAEEYRNWSVKFMSSDIFWFYRNNIPKINRAQRWCQTLSGSIA